MNEIENLYRNEAVVILTREGIFCGHLRSYNQNSRHAVLMSGAKVRNWDFDSIFNEDIVEKPILTQFIDSITFTHVKSIALAPDKIYELVTGTTRSQARDNQIEEMIKNESEVEEEEVI